jgi:adenine-specific DNA methylase
MAQVIKATKRTLIETLLPIKDLSEQAQKENQPNFRGASRRLLSNLHIWWARRPLVVSRAAVVGALLSADGEGDNNDADGERMERLEDLLYVLREVCRTGIPSHALQRARQEIRKSWGDETPAVLDVFAGGGSIPLEALRLGAKAIAVEYNPVAYLILKATIEYPQRYGLKLARDVERWARWVCDRAKESLVSFYPDDPDGKKPVAYIWSRTIRCRRADCQAEIPLFRQFWLARKENRQIALYPVVDKDAKQVHFAVVQRAGSKWQVTDASQPLTINFDPSQGTVRRATARCLVCGSPADDDYVRAEAQAGRMGHRLVAVVQTNANRQQGRTYRAATPDDMAAFEQAKAKLTQLVAAHTDDLSLIPDESAPPRGTLSCRNAIYGMDTWGKFFNARQLLSLVTFAQAIRDAHAEMLTQGMDDDYAKAVATYLAMALSKVADYSSCLSSWHASMSNSGHTFVGHRIAMAWDYCESNPLSGDLVSWLPAVRYVRRAIEHVSQTGNQPAEVILDSATLLPFEDGSLPCVVTDPPYYDNVNYAELSDFFYVWLKRSIGHLYPEALSGYLTPKEEEAVFNPFRWGSEEVARQHVGALLMGAFGEIYRVLRDDGIAVIMFTHKTTEAWDSLLSSLLSARLYVTASWSAHTEAETSTHTRDVAAVTSTVLLVCRKRLTEETGWWEEIRPKLRERVAKQLRRFWRAGIRGADFLIAGIGPAVEVFGQFAQVKDYSGKEVRIDQLLDEVHQVVWDYALRQILGEETAEGAIDNPTRFYVLARSLYNTAPFPYDEANRIAKALGVETDELAQRFKLARLGKGRRNEMNVLTAQERVEGRAIRPDHPEMRCLIDALHLAQAAWEKGGEAALGALMGELGLAMSGEFWGVAQSLASLLPDGDSDRRQLESLLTAKASLQEAAMQGRLF